MSMEAIGDVRYSRATGSEREVLVGLAYHAQRETRLSYPSNDLLARWTLRLDRRTGELHPLSHRQIQRSLRRLEQAGEIRRVEDGTGRRVYRVDPIAGHQLSLEEEAALRHLTVAEAALDVTPPCDIQGPQGDIQAPNEATSSAVGATPTRTRGRTGGTQDQNQGTKNDPHKAPPRGGDDHSRISFRNQASPDASPSATRPRRRRRGRRDQSESPPPPTVAACPLETLHGPERAALQDAWLAFIGRLREIGGGQGASSGQIWTAWQMFGAGAHAHQAQDGQLVIGCNPRTVDWLGTRYGRLLDQAAAGALVLEPCAAKLTAQTMAGVS